MAATVRGYLAVPETLWQITLKHLARDCQCSQKHWQCINNAMTTNCNNGAASSLIQNKQQEPTFNPTTTNPETKTQSTPKPTPRQHPHARSQYGGTWNRESETYKPAILTRRCSPPANSPHRYQPLCNFNPPEKAPNSQISSTDQFISSFSSLFIFLLTSG